MEQVDYGVIITKLKYDPTHECNMCLRVKRLAHAMIPTLFVYFNEFIIKYIAYFDKDCYKDLMVSITFHNHSLFPRK